MFEYESEAPQVGLDDAVKMIAAGLDALARIDLEGEDDRAVLDAALALQEVDNRVDGQQVRVIEAIDRRDAHTRDGALSPAAWLRSRTRQAPSEVTALMNAAVRLRRFPHLREALESGAITRRHVTEVTAAAVPRRAEVIAAFDEKLSDVARHGSPADVRLVVARIRDAHDDAGDVDPIEATGPDERRDLTVFDGIDGLVEVRGTLDGLDGEALRTALDAYERSDPADTPPEQRRSAGQRRADALCAILATALHAADDGAGESDGDPDGCAGAALAAAVAGTVRVAPRASTATRRRSSSWWTCCRSSASTPWPSRRR